MYCPSLILVVNKTSMLRAPIYTTVACISNSLYDSPIPDTINKTQTPLQRNAFVPTIMVKKPNYSTVPDLDEEEQSLLVLVFISTPGFLANGTFPKVSRRMSLGLPRASQCLKGAKILTDGDQVDTKQLANVANYSTAASANTAWYEVRKKLTALAKTKRPNATGQTLTTAPAAHVSSDSPASGTRSSTRKRTYRAVTDDQNEDEPEDEQAEVAPKTKRPKISVDVAITDPGTPSARTAARGTRFATAKAESLTNTGTPLQTAMQRTSKIKGAQAEEDMVGRSTYARHTRETAMAFGFPGELNMLYDDPREQEDNFNEDFGDFDFDD